MNILDYTCDYLIQEGVYFERDFIEAFLLSLKSKPFVILSGISGVGKSILPRSIMRMLGNHDCQPIAVAPDWVDNSDMLGYFDVNGKFILGEFTKLVFEAGKNPHKPYFVILDEMNLSRVEYYFAQVLSGLESRRFHDVLNRVEYDDFLFNEAIRDRMLRDSINQDLLGHLANLKLTDNVYIIGTVNIDESTYAFSKKVLARANVLEINYVDLMIGIDDIITPNQRTPFVAVNDMFCGKITNLNELKKSWMLNQELIQRLPVKETLTEWIALLNEINYALMPFSHNFGFRVRDEVCIYLYHAACQNRDLLNNDKWWYKYFDQQLVQKVLTRIGGEQGEIESELVALFNLCSNREFSQDEIIRLGHVDSEVRFPKTATKLKSMLRNLVSLDRPSTSFWSA